MKDLALKLLIHYIGRAIGGYVRAKFWILYALNVVVKTYVIESNGTNKCCYCTTLMVLRENNA